MRCVAVVFLVVSLAAGAAPGPGPIESFDGSNESIGLQDDGRFFTPVNQVLSPAGYQVEIPAIRPQALA